MRKAYTLSGKVEAIALGRLLGIEGASERLKIDRRTIRGWSERAGDPPELQGDGAQLTRIRDAAFARVETLLGSGRLTGVQAATIAAIAARGLRDQERAQRQIATEEVVAAADVDPNPLSTAAGQRLADWIAALPSPDEQHARRFVLEMVDDARQYLAEHGEPDAAGTLAEQDAGAALAFDAARDWIADHLPDAAEHFAKADVLEAARRRQRESAGRWLDDDICDTLIEAEQLLEVIEA